VKSGETMTDIKATLQQWASKMNETLEQLEKEFSEFMASEVVKASSPTEEGRQITAMRFLIARHANILIKAGGNAVPVTVLVVDKTPPRIIAVGVQKEKVEVSDIVAIVRLEEQKETIPALITMWRDAARLVSALVPGKFYATQLVMKSQKVFDDGKKFLRMACNSGAQWALDSSRADFDLRKVDKLFIEAHPKDWGALADAKDSDDQFRLVKGTVMRAFKGESKQDHRPFASLTIATDEMMMNPDTLTETNGLVAYIDPSQCRYGDSSNIYLIGTFQRSNKDNTSIVMRVNGIVSIYTVPFVEPPPEGGPGVLPIQSPPTNPNIIGEVQIQTGGPAKAPATPPPAEELFK